MTRQVAVTGLGWVTSLGFNIEEVWQKMLAGQSGITDLEKPVEVHGGEIRRAGGITDFNLKTLTPEITSRRELTNTAGKATQFALYASLQAVRDAQIPLTHNLRFDYLAVDVSRVATIISLSMADGPGLCSYHQTFLEKGGKRIGPMSVVKIMPNSPSAHVAIMLGITGESKCVATACASGTDAIGEGFRLIKDGYADLVICGGTDNQVHPFFLSCFANALALSKAGISRPFDAKRDGFVMGEGCGILVLEELEQAKKRQAKIYCRISGYGATCDASHITAPQPSGLAASRAIKIALAEAGKSPKDFGYYNAHGTSTILNDKTETLVIKKVFGQQAYLLPISSTKSMLGHTIAAAGAIEAIVCCLTIATTKIHPTINFTTPDPACDLNYCVDGSRRLRTNTVGSMSMGFGGHNAFLIFETP